MEVALIQRARIPVAGTTAMTPDRLARDGRIVVFRALPGLGDFLCVVPALRALRAAAPMATITLIGMQRTRPLVSRFNGYVDELLEFPGYPGLPERDPDIARWPAFLAEVQARRFDLALQFHGDGSVVNSIVALFGAARVAGLRRPNRFCPDPEGFALDDPAEPEPIRWLRVLERIGVPAADPSLEFPTGPADDAELGALPELAGQRGTPYVVIHPGATAPVRRWAASGFAAVADRLADDGYAIVLTGTAGERDVVARVATAMTAPAHNLAGCTSLGAMGSLVRDASLVLCNDSGVSHLAAALRTPSVVVFSVTDPARWAPLDRARHRPVRPDLAEVLTAARGLLASERGHAA
jgi:ADP-heptose:LPS heptosyltransferase